MVTTARLPAHTRAVETVRRLFTEHSLPDADLATANAEHAAAMKAHLESDGSEVYSVARDLGVVLPELPPSAGKDWQWPVTDFLRYSVIEGIPPKAAEALLQAYARQAFTRDFTRPGQAEAAREEFRELARRNGIRPAAIEKIVKWYDDNFLQA